MAQGQRGAAAYPSAHTTPAHPGGPGSPSASLGSGAPAGGVGTLSGSGHTVSGANSGGAGIATSSGSAPRKLSGRRRRETVAVLIFSGAPIFESSIPLSVFGVDRQDAGVPRYRLLVCAGEDGPLTTTGGMTLTAPFGLEALARAGTIVVPAWRSISQPPPAEAIAALRKAHHEGARIIGLCTGAFVLAAAGLLDGRPATTHWMYAPTLAKRYPRVHVDPRELFVDDGDVLTSAGTAAGIDLCLHVVRSDHGAEAANALARRLVVPNRRSGGGQAQYIDQSLPEEIGNDPLAEVVTWALENLNQQFDVEVLAARAYMSRRTFDRRFRTLTGSAPLQWLITQRVLQAQRLLETSELSVDDVARRCGFRSPVALRGHFRRQLGVSPAAYRTSYRARRPGPIPNVGVPAQGGSAERPLGVPAGAAASPYAGPGAAGPGGGPTTSGPASGAAGTAQGGYQGQSGTQGHGQGSVGQYGSPGQPGQSGVGRPAPAQPALPTSAKNRIRPLVPPQPGPATRRGPARPVEHAVAEDGHSQPSARGKSPGARAERPSPEAASSLGGGPSSDGRLAPAGSPPPRPGTDRPAAGRLTADRLSAERLAADRLTADRQGGTRSGDVAVPQRGEAGADSGRVSGHGSAGDGPGMGGSAADRPAADGPATDGATTGGRLTAGQVPAVDSTSGAPAPEADRPGPHPNAPREAADDLPLPASRDRAVG
ncbi:transcriptional regulator GlxA family with amidase domain [Kitasatospora sp. MAP12-9]